MAATKSMIDYAIAIAEKLHIDEPDFSNFNETSLFISEHSLDYKKIVNNERMVLSLENMYGVFENDFSDDFKDLLETLYGVQGIYVFWDNDEIVYIGKSVNLQSRIYSSLKERQRTRNITHISLVFTKREADMHIYEVILITEYKPVLNLDCACADYSRHIKSNLDLHSGERIKIFEERRDSE